MPTPVNAFDLAHDLEMARDYLKGRNEDLRKLMETLPSWTPWHCGPFAIMIQLYGQTIVHELKPGTLHASPCWGELFWDEQHALENDPVPFWHFENFAAFMLAKFW
jgi:hypothetical protein